MTWYYSISNDGSEMDIYEDDAEYSGLIKTVTNDGSGFEIPTAIMQAMRETWEQEANIGNSPVMNVRAGQILMDIATIDIEEGTPP